MGTPIDECYPASNAHLKQRIIEKGLVLSQFVPGGRVFKSNFPKRNTLIASLSDITIIAKQVKRAVLVIRLESPSGSDGPSVSWRQSAIAVSPGLRKQLIPAMGSLLTSP